VLDILKMTAVPESVVIPSFSQYLDDEERFCPSEQIESAARTLLNELARWSPALMALRSA
jgi:hypothetical protein